MASKIEIIAIPGKGLVQDYIKNIDVDQKYAPPKKSGGGLCGGAKNVVQPIYLE